MKFECVAIHNNRVSGVVSAVEPDHIVRLSGKEISNFSFTFIAPLGSNNCSNLRRVGRHAVP